jgi:hypothetical protein
LGAGNRLDRFRRGVISETLVSLDWWHTFAPRYFVGSVVVIPGNHGHHYCITGGSAGTKHTGTRLRTKEHGDAMIC